MVEGGLFRNQSSDIMVQGGPLSNHSHQTLWCKVVHSVITAIRRNGPRWSIPQSQSSDVMVQGGAFRNHSHQTSRSKMVHLRSHSHQTSWSKVFHLRNHNHQTSWSKVLHSVITIIRRHGPRWSTFVSIVTKRHGQGCPLRNHSHKTYWSEVVHP